MKYSTKITGGSTNFPINVDFSVEVSLEESAQQFAQLKEVPALLKDFAGSLDDIVTPIAAVVLKVKGTIEAEEAKDSAAYDAKQTERSEGDRKDHEAKIAYYKEEHELKMAHLREQADYKWNASFKDPDTAPFSTTTPKEDPTPAEAARALKDLVQE